MMKLCQEKIAIIIHSTDEQYLEECMNYIELLDIPDGYSIDVMVVTDNLKITDSYNEAMNASDAKYKLYLSEYTFIVQRDCLKQCIKLFEENEKLGMLGVLGVKGVQQTETETWNVGKAIVSDTKTTRLLDFQKEKEKYYIADRVDESFIFTQYDIPWKENVSEQNDIFIDSGYSVAVPYQEIAWCQVDKGVFEESGENGQQLYNYIKFLLRRIQFQFPAEKTQEFFEDYEEGFISDHIVDGILEREIMYAKRVRHMITIQNKKDRYCDTNGFIGKEMNIVTSLNRKYVPQVCVMLESLYCNNQEVSIHVYLLHSELLEEDKKIIIDHGNKWGASVEFLQVNEKLFEKLPTTEIWSVEALYRLAMTDILPANVDRVLYLDVDTIVLKPVYDLYFSDFEGKDLFACRDMGSRLSKDLMDRGEQIPFGDIRDEIFRERLEKGEFIYFCSGVTLWNIEKLRGKVTLDTYLQVAEKLNYCVLAPDQDLINLVHGEQTKLVDEYRYGCFVKGYDWNIDEVKRYVSILHYAGVTKPWKGNIPKIEAYKVWWEYAKNTPMYLPMLEKCFDESYETDKMLCDLYVRVRHMIK